MKKVLILFLALMVGTFMALGCEEPAEAPEEDEKEEEVEEKEPEEEEKDEEDEDVAIDVSGLVAADMDLEDGTYEGTAEGHEGDVTLEVTIEDGEIVEIGNFDHQETEDLSDPAFEKMPDRIIDAGGTDVDGVTEVTVSSEAIALAVEDALQKAEEGVEEEEEEEADEEEEAKEEDEEADEEVVSGTAEGFGGDLTVDVTMDGDEIVDIEVVEHSESEDDMDEVVDALETVPQSIIDAQSTDVDAVSGATDTSEAIMNAVNEATGL
ncbi:FMN-binding protein [Natranaerofaba carboxydovora]|uniref:FMN-binding protein n=1 Tax=Natranaerofaba carboxydovora TaxID=2742683 RepID=UPI001F13D99E|nr:FMN-binding protein [Natranaerofaba carboxydovora]UMZ73173.1 Urocanate reductase [Natranaerofaba carboxydovora]